MKSPLSTSAERVSSYIALGSTNGLSLCHAPLESKAVTPSPHSISLMSCRPLSVRTVYFFRAGMRYTAPSRELLIPIPS